MKNINEAFDKMIKKILKAQNMNSFNKNKSKIHINDDETYKSKKSKGCC